MKQETIETFWKEFRAKNEAASEKKCKKVLDDLRKSMQEKIETEKYSRAGGYADFQNDRDAIRQEYQGHNELGVKVRA